MTQGPSARTFGSPSMVVELKVVPMDQTAHSEKLLNGSKTIAESGCLLSAMSMTATHITGNTSLDPPKANEMIRRKPGACVGSALEVPVAARVLGMQQTRRSRVTSSSVNEASEAIARSLRSGRPVVVGIDIGPGSSSARSRADHFLTVTGLGRDGSFVGVDPWGGVRVALRKVDGQLKRGDAPVTEMIFFDKAT